MLTRAAYNAMVRRFVDWCENPSARYAALLRFLDLPYDCDELTALRPTYLGSDIVEQLYREQSPNGDWGPLRDKNYSVKAVFPTTFVALERCFHIGLTLHDRDILFLALDYLEEFLAGTSATRLYDKNERAVPIQLCEIAAWVERIQPGNPLCDRIWGEWVAIAMEAFADGAYSHDRDMAAQHQTLGTREKRLVPLPVDLLLSRREQLPHGLEAAMCEHFGRYAYENGYFWEKNLLSFPDDFRTIHTRRWFHTIKYINRFRGTERFLAPAVEWLLANQNGDGLWDYGGQVKDPWGYFGNFSTSRNDKVNREVDCTMEVLGILKTYLDHNEAAMT